MTEVTGDARYAAAADAYVRATCQRAVKPNGLLGWGSHIRCFMPGAPELDVAGYSLNPFQETFVAHQKHRVQDQST